MKLLENNNVLITGAARGIGRCTALTLAEQGANIAFTDLAQSADTDSLCKEIEAMGCKALFIPANAADYEQTVQVVDQVHKAFGSIDSLVNNAGITKDTLLLRMTPDAWQKVIDINLGSVFNYPKAVSAIMLRQRSGSIVSLSSIVGLIGNAGQSNYSASKAGIIGFTRSVAKELGSRNIRCNAVAPGFIQTAMTDAISDEAREFWNTNIPLHRPGTPQDVANTILYLLSPLSTYITGQVLSCDGGLAL